MNPGDRRGLDEARRLLESGKLREAYSRLLHLTEKYPDDEQVRGHMAEALVMQGATHAEAGEFGRAMTEFERSIRFSETPEAHINLGKIHLVKGEFEDAFSEYSKALDLNEDLPVAHEALGHYFLETKDFDQAANAFGRAIAKGGHTRGVYLGIWEAYVGAGKMDHAHDAIMDALKRWPEDDGILGWVGLSFAVAQNDHESAEEYWKKAVVRNPKNLPSLFNLSGLAALRGHREEALDYLKRCVAVDKSRTLEMWGADRQDPRRKFAAYEGDEDFLDVLGVI